MKSTKIMLVCIACFLTTWFTVSLLAYVLSSTTDFRTCATNGGTVMFMVIFGWIPAFIVAYDLVEKYANEKNNLK